MSTINTLNDWLFTPPGKYLMGCEQILFDQSVAGIFGYHAIQLGLAGHDLLRASRMPLRAVTGNGNETGIQVQLDAAELPFGCGSLDLVVLPHVLEFHAHPHQILREVVRVLRPEGNVLISGFNPRSLWGMRRALGSQMNYPWCGEFIALPRLKDWLALLGLDVVTGRFACYAPPFSNPNWLDHFHFMEPAGDRWWAIWGGVYFLQATKHVSGMHLIKPRWNEGLVGKLLPAAPKLNREISQCTRRGPNERICNRER